MSRWVYKYQPKVGPSRPPPRDAIINYSRMFIRSCLDSEALRSPMDYIFLVQCNFATSLGDDVAFRRLRPFRSMGPGMRLPVPPPWHAPT